MTVLARRRSLRAAAVAAVGGLTLAAGATAARAETVTATLDGVSPSQIVGINYNGSYLGQAYAGALNWHGEPSNSHGLTAGFDTFCIDLTQDVYIGSTYTYTIAAMDAAPNPTPPTAPVGSTGMGAANAQRVENLYALEYDTIGSDNDRGAAFQIALWEMLFDTNPGDVTAGMFNTPDAPAAVKSLANQYVSEAIGSAPLTFHHALLAMTSPDAQDQLFLGDPVSPPERGPAVPMPAASLGALPLLGLLAARKHQKRRRDAL